MRSTGAGGVFGASRQYTSVGGVAVLQMSIIRIGRAGGTAGAGRGAVELRGRHREKRGVVESLSYNV